jgi:hypothetical protein
MDDAWGYPHDFRKSSATRLQQLHQIQFELMNGKGLTQAPAAAPWFGGPRDPIGSPETPR